MKSLVVYSSQTGNTRRLAQAVFDVFPGEKELCSVDEAPDPSAYDWVAVGFWFKSGKPDPLAADYLAKIGKQSLFLFATHGAATGSKHAVQGMEFAKSLASESDVQGTYSCQGEVDPRIVEKARSKKPEPPVWVADAPAAKGHPNDVDIQSLQQKVLELFAV